MGHASLVHWVGARDTFKAQRAPWLWRRGYRGQRRKKATESVLFRSAGKLKAAPNWTIGTSKADVVADHSTFVVLGFAGDAGGPGSCGAVVGSGCVRLRGLPRAS